MSQMEPAKTNGQIIKVAMVADQGEIAEAKLAERKAVCMKVKRYARYLQQQHTAGLHCIMKVSHKTHIKPESSRLAQDLQQHNANELKMLKASSRQDFDKNYMNATVQDHQDALNFLDNAIKESTNPMLTKDLKIGRQHIAAHLEKAKKLQQEIGS